MLWNARENTDEENLRWSLLRAIEWGRWPFFKGWDIWQRQTSIGSGVETLQMSRSLCLMRYLRCVVTLFALALTSGFDSYAQNGRAPMTTSASLPIDKYKLDMPIEGITGLTEFSLAEYAIIGQTFEGEKNYNAPGVEFLKRHWKVALGTVGGKVYKIVLYFESDSKQTVIKVSTDVMEYCQQRLGKPTEQQETLFTWDTPDGNVMVSLGGALHVYQINLIETSRSARTFTLKR